MESSRSKKGSSQAACHCICWKCSNFNPSVRTQNCPDLYSLAIHGIDSGKKNIVLLPMENRHSHVYQLLLKINIPKDIYTVFGGVDDKGKSALHLAAMFTGYHLRSLLMLHMGNQVV